MQKSSTTSPQITIVYANGVSTFFGKLTVKVLSVVNYCQQQKYNKRTVRYINGNMP